MSDPKIVPLDARRVNDNDLHGNTDPQAWAERFVEKYEAGVFAHGIDEALMVTWFASVMATGHDSHPVEQEKQRRAVADALEGTTP